MNNLENPQQEQQMDSLELSLDQVDWKGNYKLSRASIGQILFSFKNVLRVKSKNRYEEILYAKLKPAIEILIKNYEDTLKCESPIEKNVKYYNLIVNMPANIEIYKVEHENIFLRNARIGALIKAMKQRVTFMLQRNIPTIYLNNQDALNEFNKMKQQLEIFAMDVESFEKEFVDAIDIAHKSRQDDEN